MATVTLSSVGKTYPGGVTAVQDATLDFKDGEFIVLVGPSGCGKSTLLRMIAGLESITSGEVRIGGQVVNNMQAKDRDVAMVFQNYALYPHMTVRRNMSFGLMQRRTHGGLLATLLRSSARAEELRQIAQRVEDTARSLDIQALLDRYPRQLSGGQRQRVALGRALVRQPRVFLFDEPLSNLDARLRIEMRAELRTLHRRTRGTMIYVTHDQEEAMTLADRMVVMRNGQVQQFGTPDEVYARPANRFVAAFVGVPVMNFFEGAVEGGVFRAQGLSLQLPEGRWPAALHGPFVLGVRPDQISVGADLSAPGCLRARLDAVEQLGDRTDLVLALGSHRVVARTAPQRGLAEGSDVCVHLNLRHAHLFHPGETGARLV
ncbi:MAG: sn-glycerol-3-phosphate ABC transporter ATP-binding protein UgpC [Phycisphaerales bacterium]